MKGLYGLQPEMVTTIFPDRPGFAGFFLPLHVEWTEQCNILAVSWVAATPHNKSWRVNPEDPGQKGLVWSLFLEDGTINASCIDTFPDISRWAGEAQDNEKSVEVF